MLKSGQNKCTNSVFTQTVGNQNGTQSGGINKTTLTHIKNDVFFLVVSQNHQLLILEWGRYLYPVCCLILLQLNVLLF